MTSVGSHEVSADFPLPTLVGRAGELKALYDLVDQVEQRGGALVIRGEAGVGKSSLLMSAMARAREHGWVVASTTAVQLEAQFAFVAVRELLEPLVGRIDRLPLPQRRAIEVAFGLADGDAPDLFLVGLAAFGLITDAAAESPLLLVVEDAQWLDRPSCEVLGFIARRLELDPVILLCAVRNGISSDVDDAGLPEIQLSGLDHDAAGTLLDRTAPDLSADIRTRILDEAHGNPLALIELPAALANSDPDEVWSAAPLPLTERLEQAFAAQLERVAADTRTVLLLAALEEGELRVLLRAAERLCGHEIEAESLAPAVAFGLGTVEVGRFRFRHPLIRSAVEQAATPEERQRAHAALSVVTGDEDRSVWHRAAAAQGPDEPVAEALEAVAERTLRRGGSGVAAAALERAAGLTADPGRRAQRLLRAAAIALDGGRANVSLRLLREAEALPLSQLERAQLSYYLEVIEGGWSGSQSFQRFIALAAEIADAGAPAQALQALEIVAVRAYWSDLDDETRRTAVAVVNSMDVPPDEPLRLMVLALTDPAQVGGEVIERLKHVDVSDIHDASRLLAFGVAASAVWAEDLAVRFLRSAGERARVEGRLSVLVAALSFQSWALIHRGDARAAAPLADEAARLAAEVSQSRFIAAAKAAEAVAAAERGADADADRLVAEVEALLIPLGTTPLLALVEVARGRQALAAERFAEAYEHFHRIFDPQHPAHHPFVRGWVLADLVESALHGDRGRDVPERAIAELGRVAERTRAPHLLVQLSLARAMLAADSDGETDADGRLRAAIVETADWPSYRARAQLAYGIWLRRQRRYANSRVPLRDAAGTFDALGLTRLGERARRELRASGETARKRVPEAWSQLTPQELQIAELAAEGLSNREIGERLYLSPRTIGSHLYRLFPKLGITSRAQLGAALGSTLAP